MNRQGAPRQILFVADKYPGPTGGTERQLVELVGRLDRQRYEPSLVVLRPTPFLTDGGSFPCPVELMHVPRMADPGVFVFLGRFARMLRSRRIDLVHVFFNDAAILVPPVARLVGARVVASRRDLGFWHTPGRLALLRMSNRFVHRFVANSEAVRTNLCRTERIALNRISVIPNGCDPSRFEVPPDSSLRSRLGIPHGAVAVAIVANFNPWKRHIDLIDALAIARRAGRDLHVVMIGEGRAAAHFQERSRSLGLEAYVHIVTGLSEPVPAIKAIDICALCSETEGLSNAIIEYMFCGKPIVATAVGGNPELIEHEVTGLLVPPRSPSHLAAAIGRMIDEPALAARLATASRASAHARFATDRMVEDHMTLYDGVVRGPAAGAA